MHPIEAAEPAHVEDTHLKIPAHAPLHLLHQSPVGTLATHSREPQGFPYPTVLPFAPDARHRPIVLVSRLAEHTRNLQADPRAGFLVAHAPDGGVLNGQRVTLIGRFEPLGDHCDERAQAVAHRYLRYHPDAERYLALGDFSFWVMAPERLRYIGGFGSMGWLDADELDPLDPLPPEEEAALAQFFDRHPQRPANLELAGVDRHGADLKIGGERSRFVFDAPKPDAAALEDALSDCIARQPAD